MVWPLMVKGLDRLSCATGTRTSENTSARTLVCDTLLLVISTLPPVANEAASAGMSAKFLNERPCASVMSKCVPSTTTLMSVLLSLARNCCCNVAAKVFRFVAVVGVRSNDTPPNVAWNFEKPGLAPAPNMGLSTRAWELPLIQLATCTAAERTCTVPEVAPVAVDAGTNSTPLTSRPLLSVMRMSALLLMALANKPCACRLVLRAAANWLMLPVLADGTSDEINWPPTMAWKL